MILIGFLIILAVSLRAIYRQGWNRGYLHQVTGDKDSKLRVLAMVILFFPGWVAYEIGYDQGANRHGEDLEDLHYDIGEPDEEG